MSILSRNRLSASRLRQERDRAYEEQQQHASAFSSLLDRSNHDFEPASSPPRQLRSRAKSSLLDYHSKPWLAVVENQERAPARKLVKDMNGSRPSFSTSLSDSDGAKEKGLLRRQIAKLKSFYRREK
ncbi:hypothetical protein QBC35DRAFT_447349 [Podospora australis]|uniref:Uncharacterized protein n=1 Tax=Podospora australis TaxID=1536484 RepID=A0AAN6X2N3_9PEZI|nr:hypothetical protein QBC35DRAFT_447349 [Podospora australis]